MERLKHALKCVSSTYAFSLKILLMKLETRAIHAGLHEGEATKSIAPPLHLTTIFQHPETGFSPENFGYSRYDNPNRRQLETLLTDLEGGAASLAFGSGMAAIAAVVQSLKPGDSILAPIDIYNGTRRLFNEILAHWSVDIEYIDMTDATAFEQGLKNKPTLVWIETPSNPRLLITDLDAFISKSKQVGAKVVVDNTWMTPILQQPLKFGADVVMHSTTKYMGGHSDVLGGALIFREKDTWFDQVKVIQQIGGAVPSPFDCWLLYRSIRTLPYRMRGHCENARKVANYLARHPRVERVYYPGLPSDPGHTIALKQMKDFGGMLSFQVKGANAQETLAVVAKAKLISRATSLGAIESLWEHRKTSESPTSPTPDNLIRMSVGLEHPDDIIVDVEQALS